MKPIVLFFQSTSAKSWKDKLTGVYAYADTVGWQIQVVEAGSSAGAVRQALQKWNPIGCLVDRGLQNSRPPRHLFGRTPVVFLDQNPANACDCTTLTHDSCASVVLAADELIRLKLPQLAYVAWDRPCFWNRERERAFVRYARERNVEARAFALSADIERNLLRLPTPCGVICANDMTAQKVVSEAVHAGLRIPDDLAVIGIDNDEFICEHTQPSLTSVDPGFVEAGHRLAELLHERLRHPHRPHTHTTYGPKALVRRESSRWQPAVDPRVREALEFIRRDFADPGLTVTRVVERMGCSRSLADHLFRKATGGSVMSEILQTRIGHACRLLQNPRQKIGAISALCGYASEPFFKRAFRRETGLTMRDWRKWNPDGRTI